MKRLLVLNIFPLLSRTKENENYSYSFYEELSYFLDITFLSLTDKCAKYEFKEFNFHFREHRIPAKLSDVQVHNKVLENKCINFYRLKKKTKREIQKTYQQLIHYSDIVIHLSTFTMSIDENFGKDRKLRMYISDNFRHLTEGTTPHNEFPFSSAIKDEEEKLVQRCELIIVNSTDEKKLLEKTYNCKSGKIIILRDEKKQLSSLQTPCSLKDSALKISKSIESLAAQRRKAKRLYTPQKILLLNDFPVSEPVQGGEIRINKLFSSLSQDFDVTLLCFSYDNDIREISITRNFREIRIPKTDEHRQREAEFISHHTISINDIISSMMCVNNELMLYHFYELTQESDILICEHPYMVPLLDYSKVRLPLIYESHNVESTLKEKILSPLPDFNDLIKIVRTLESRVCKEADHTICVSDSDYDEFSQKAGHSKVHIIRNGVSFNQERCYNRDMISEIKSIFSGLPVAVFIGSAHPPNVEAAEFIVKNIAAHIPFVYFIIMGSSCHCLDQVQMPQNVLLFGITQEYVKNVIFNLADIALNPMFSGGGSSLKITDYFAASLPVISTLLGIRGFNVKDGEHFIKSEPEEFYVKICSLLTDTALAKKIKRAGFQYVQKYLDWNVLAKDYKGVINGLLS